MNEEVSGLLSELKYAIDQALWGSERISEAIAALAHVGENVQIAVDASLLDHEAAAAYSPIVPQGTPCSAALFRLNAKDMQFLGALKISSEAEFDSNYR
jgi:hypothetical protein